MYTHTGGGAVSWPGERADLAKQLSCKRNDLSSILWDPFLMCAVVCVYNSSAGETKT